MGLDTKMIRTRAKLSVAVDLDRPADKTGRITRAEAERLVIDWLLENPTVLRENLRVTFRLEKDGES